MEKNAPKEYAEDYAKQREIDIAKNLLAAGDSIEKICSCTGLKPKDFMQNSVFQERSGSEERKERRE
ncbi:hypothetical protein U1Q18_051377, partial [Sarracenia purpurea var. burkii]